MIGIRIYNQLLDLYPGTVIEFILNNPMFMGGDLDKVLGSYSYPLNLPLTDFNRKVLNFPDRIDNTSNHIVDEDCEIMFDGKIVFQGLATIKSSDTNRCKFYIVIDNYKTLKTANLNELELGSHSFASVQEILDHAKDTALNPLSHTHAFFPVMNSGFFSADDQPEELNGNPFPHRFINYYDPSTQTFISSIDQHAASPFVRIDHIFESMGALLDLHIDNQFQTSDELKKLYLYNDKNLYNEINAWETTYDLSDHMPDRKIADFIKECTRLFCLGAFIDRFKKQIEIIPLKTVLQSAFKYNWTDKTAKDYQISTETDYPGSFGYMSEGDELFSIQPYMIVDDFTEVDKTTDAIPHGTYYIRAYNEFWKTTTDPGRPVVFYKKMFRQLALGDGEEYLFKMSPLFQTGGTAFVRIAPISLRPTPEILQMGGTNTEFRITFYRGMYENENGDLFPYASNNLYDPKQNRIPELEYSLLWNGDKSMFDQWWKEWVNFLQKKKEVLRTINLHITDILNFSFKDKVKIENNQYFVKQMKVSLSDAGVLPTQCKLITIL